MFWNNKQSTEKSLTTSTSSKVADHTVKKDKYLNEIKYILFVLQRDVATYLRYLPSKLRVYAL